MVDVSGTAPESRSVVEKSSTKAEYLYPLESVLYSSKNRILENVTETTQNKIPDRRRENSDPGFWS